MAIKEKLVATMLNHWWCVDRLTTLGVKARTPTVQKYKAKLDIVEKATDDELKELDDHFCNQNYKAFQLVLKALLSNSGVENGVVEDKGRGKGLRVAVPLKGMKLEQLEKFRIGLRAPNQIGSVNTIVETLPMFSVDGDGNTSISLEIACAKKSFYENLGLLEQQTLAGLDSAAKFGQICDLLRDKLDPPVFKDLIDGQIYIVFEELDFKGGKIIASKFSPAETEEARASRELQARLEAELRKRIKKVRSLAVDPAGSIRFDFEDPLVLPVKINLDIITDW